VGAGEVLEGLMLELPGDPRFLRERVCHLMYTGRLEEALREAERTCELFPDIASLSFVRCQILYVVHRFDEALERIDETLAAEPNMLEAIILSGVIHAVRGEFDAARDDFREVASASPLSSFSFLVSSALSAAVSARSGDSTGARRRLDSLLMSPEHRSGFAPLVALVHFALGDTDIGFEWLERSLDRPSFFYYLLKVDPLFDDVRGDPRFQAILRKMGLGES
jgi:serine/threonine-protein kinase